MKEVVKLLGLRPILVDDLLSECRKFKIDSVQAKELEPILKQIFCNLSKYCSSMQMIESFSQLPEDQVNVVMCNIASLLIDFFKANDPATMLGRKNSQRILSTDIRNVPQILFPTAREILVTLFQQHNIPLPEGFVIPDTNALNEFEELIKLNLALSYRLKEISSEQNMEIVYFELESMIVLPGDISPQAKIFLRCIDGLARDKELKRLFDRLLLDFISNHDNEFWSVSSRNNFGYRHRDKGRIKELLQAQNTQKMLHIVVSQMDSLADELIQKEKVKGDILDENYLRQAESDCTQDGKHLKNFLINNKRAILKRFREIRGVYTLSDLAANVDNDAMLTEDFCKEKLNEQIKPYLLLEAIYKLLEEKLQNNSDLYDELYTVINHGAGNTKEFFKVIYTACQPRTRNTKQNKSKIKKEIINTVNTYYKALMAFAEKIVKSRTESGMSVLGISIIGPDINGKNIRSHINKNIAFLTFNEKVNVHTGYVFLELLCTRLFYRFQAGEIPLSFIALGKFSAHNKKMLRYIMQRTIEMIRSKEITEGPVYDALKSDSELGAFLDPNNSFDASAIKDTHCVEATLWDAVHDGDTFSVALSGIDKRDGDWLPLDDGDGKILAFGRAGSQRMLIPPCNNRCQVYAFAHAFWGRLGAFKSREAPAPVLHAAYPINTTKTTHAMLTTEICEGKIVSRHYWYEDNEINRILRLLCTSHHNVTLDGRPLHILGPLDNLSLYGLREALLAHSRQAGLVLIPFNIGQMHWVGLVLEYDSSGALIRADFYDPMGDNVPSLLDSILNTLSHGVTQFNCVSDNLIRQDNGSDCGPCTIANLLASAGYPETDGISAIRRRFNHLQLIEASGDVTFYNDFYHRQQHNQSSFKNILPEFKTEQTSTSDVQFSVSEQQSLLLLALMILDLPADTHNAIRQGLAPVSAVDVLQEHQLQLTKLRSALEQHMAEEGMKAIIQAIFNYHSGDNLQNAPLLINYNQVPLLRSYLAKTKQDLQALLKSITTQAERNYILFIAAFMGNTGLARQLIGCDAHVNSQHTDPRNGLTGKTPLFIAAEMGHIEMVRLLMANGANPTIRDAGFWRPYDVALEMKRQYGRNECSPCVLALK